MTRDIFTPTVTHKPLIAGVLRKTIGPRRNASAVGFSDAERHAVRTAVADGRDVPERALDHVVDRLLKELTW
jgi:hypothetical protein